LGETKASFDALDRAERSFAQAPLNPWGLGDTDEASLAWNRGRCFLLLGRPEAAESLFREVSAFRGPERVVSRALVSVDLATSLADQNHLEEACRVVSEALAIPSDYQLTSVIRRAKKFRARLEPKATHPAVRDFDEQLRSLKV
jgi:hypothetical protein